MNSASTHAASLYREGRSAAEVAQLLDCSRQQVIAAVHGRPFTPAAQDVVRMSARQARRLDRREGWRPREGAPHPRGRADTHDRDRVLVQSADEGFEIVHELWIYAAGRWTMHARTQVQTCADEAQMLEVRGALLALAEAREEARIHGGLVLRTPLRAGEDVEAARDRAGLLAQLNA